MIVFSGLCRKDGVRSNRVSDPALFGVGPGNGREAGGGLEKTAKIS